MRSGEETKNSVLLYNSVCQCKIYSLDANISFCQYAHVDDEKQFQLDKKLYN